MSHEIVSTAKEKMGKTIGVMTSDFNTLRAGRANAQVLDKLQVDYYGTMTPIGQLGNISIPEPRVLMISVWDTKALKSVEKAILTSDIGINPSNDGKVIRLVFPELTQERRKELSKTVAKRAEESKVAVRSIRRDANDQLKKLKKASEITEDDLKTYEEDMQELTDEQIKLIDKHVAEKTRQIMEV